MRILAFSGSHNNKYVTDAFLERIKTLDTPSIFISAGDLGPTSMSRIFSSISDRDVPILYVMGNHVLHHGRGNLTAGSEEINKLSNVQAINHEKFELNGWTFIGQDAWTDFTDDEKDLERYHDLMRKTGGTNHERTILVTHHAPLGIFDAGFSYPLHSYEDAYGIRHAGSLALRFFVDQYAPRIHIFAHCHSDGTRSSIIDGTLFVNVCHLERRTRGGKYGLTGSFEVIDTDSMDVLDYHLSQDSPRTCPSCGCVNYIRYRRCVNCTKGSTGIIRREQLP